MWVHCLVSFCEYLRIDVESLLQQIKQIGNAVAVPFALALGKEFGEACFADWKAQRERLGSPEI